MLWKNEILQRRSPNKCSNERLSGIQNACIQKYRGQRRVTETRGDKTDALSFIHGRNQRRKKKKQKQRMCPAGGQSCIKEMEH